MFRLLRGFSRLLGALITLVLALGIPLLALRFVQVRFFFEPPEPERLAQKRAYLDAIGPVDPGSAPNVVVIFFDDLGWGDLSSYGNPLIRTPRIDSLAEAGVRMTTFYSASSVCTPSRAALLTGRYPPRTDTHEHVFFDERMPMGVARRMLGWPNELPRDEILLPEVLGRAGYATGMVGKWHLGGRPGHRPTDLGFDSWYGVLWSNDMQPLHVYRDEEIAIRDTTRRGWDRQLRDEEKAVPVTGEVDQAKLTRRYTEQAIAFIERHRDEPFFLYLSHTFPHVPHFADPEHAGTSEGGLYGDVVEDLDRSTGAVVDALERLGLAERTLLIVTSDNGADYGGSPGFLRGRKQETYEGGHRVPLVAAWPGRIPAGAVSDAMAMNIDLFPTLLGLLGLPLPEDRVIDGRDIGPVWVDGAETPHELLYFFPALGSEPDAVRDPEFKYRANTGDWGRRRPALWRVDVDPEAHDLRRRHPEETERLARALARMTREVEENRRGWNP